MSYHFKNYVDISIFFRDMAFLMRQDENMRNPAFLAVSGPPVTARFTKMAKNVIFLLISLIFSYLKLSKRSGKNRKSILWGTRRPLTQEARLPQTGASPGTKFLNFSNRFESSRYEKMSKNEQENNIFCHFIKSGPSWGPRNYQKSWISHFFTLPH